MERDGRIGVTMAIKWFSNSNYKENYHYAWLNTFNKVNSKNIADKDKRVLSTWSAAKLLLALKKVISEGSIQ